MKNMILKVLIIAAFFMLANEVIAQGPPEPPGGHGQSGNQPAGGGAPIGSGIAILLSLGAAYGGRKVYKAWKNSEELEE